MSSLWAMSAGIRVSCCCTLILTGCSAGTHDNVVALRGLCQHQNDIYLVMEYCPRGTLDALLHHSARRFWNPQKLVALLIAVVRGMVHLHAQRPPLLHRDLKPGNIFLGELL